MMPRRQKLFSFVVGLMLLGSLTGCWDQGSFNQRAAALILTVSVTPRPGQWQWTFYFPNPAVTVSSLTQQSSKAEFYSVSVTASSLAQAYGYVQQRLARDLYLGELEDIVWSSKIPTSTVVSLMDAYNREGLPPKTAYTVVAQSPNKVVMVTPQEKTPSVYLTSYFDCQTCQPEFLSHQAWEVWTAINTPGVSPVVPYASSAERISQIAVYPLSGPPVIFSRQETRGWAYLRGRVRKEILSLSIPIGPVTLARVESRVSTQLAESANAIQVHAHIQVKGILVQWPTNHSPTGSQLQEVEKAAERQVLADSVLAIKAANASHTDPFGYGRTLFFMHPEPAGVRPSYRLPIDAHITVRVMIREVGAGS